MTAPLLSTPLGIRAADLRDAGEAARIDAFVRDQPGATPFHLTAWSRAVEAGCRQRARYLVAERGNGAIAGVLPLTEMRSVLFGRALVSTGFGVGGGVLGDALEPLAAGASDLAQRLNCPSVELRGGEAPAGWAVDDATYVGFARPLAASDDAELAAIPRKQRAEVRRALGGELEVTVGRDAAALAEHHRVYAESVRNLGTPVFPAALFRAVAASMDADILTVRHRGRAVASVLSLYAGGTAYPYWGGGTRAARGLRANELMYFALMGHARARGCMRFDFGRSKAGTGAAAFKKNWGFAPAPLRYARRSDGPARAVNPLDPKYALMVRTWQRLPLPLATALGPWIARGLG
ncbi:FemAB family XrtA/PEP-CTERM system-associated protein [uncultured Sphingomonas sp.]|uniref:FemAB family XrtA/PEP-CTERM system-associated protein n=1 Tax=uncultured Sphingomonas sp. TaxID=158754 RepID=UPI0035CBA7C8